MSVSLGPLCAAATATGGKVAPFNREGREAAHKSFDPGGGGSCKWPERRSSESWVEKDVQSLPLHSLIIWKEMKLSGFRKIGEENKIFDGC